MSFEKVMYIEKVGPQRVYDLEVEEDHSFIANEIIVHNCQQMPSQGIEGKWFKPVFIAPDGYVKGKCDFSGFQVRIAGILSGDKNLIRVHTELGGDVHSMTSVGIFRPEMTVQEFMKVKNQLPYSYERYSSKTINFAFLFGRSHVTFADELREIWSEKTAFEYINRFKLSLIEDDPYLTSAKDFREKFFGSYPDLEKWIENCKLEGRSHGYTEGVYGARRHVPYMVINAENTDRKKYANYNNISVNSRVQSFEVLHVSKSMTKIQKEFDRKQMKTQTVGMTHDSLDFYVHKDEIELLEPLLRECCEDHHTYSIPLLIDVEIEGAKKK